AFRAKRKVARVTSPSPASRSNTMPDTPERLSHKVDPGRVKTGALMAFVYYARVKRANSAGPSVDMVGLDRDQGEFTVHGQRLIANSFSADQFLEEVKVTMTRAAEVLVSSFNRPLTVCFVKQAGGLRVL